VERLVRAFVAGEAQVDPATPQTCSYCPVIDICRILEHTGQAEPALAGDEDE
jgi:hypothetical protein